MITLEINNSTEPALPCTTDWNAINWHKVEKYVNNLQQRIYRAESSKEFRRVKRLQKMCLNSKAVLLIAIRKVTQFNEVEIPQVSMVSKLLVQKNVLNYSIP